MSTPIRAALDEQIEGIKDEVQRLASLVDIAIDESMRALSTRDAVDDRHLWLRLGIITQRNAFGS